MILFLLSLGSTGRTQNETIAKDFGSRLDLLEKGLFEVVQMVEKVEEVNQNLQNKVAAIERKVMQGHTFNFFNKKLVRN